MGAHFNSSFTAKKQPRGVKSIESLSPESTEDQAADLLAALALVRDKPVPLHQICPLWGWV
jgi:hypothetical protein